MAAFIPQTSTLPLWESILVSGRVHACEQGKGAREVWWQASFGTAVALRETEKRRPGLCAQLRGDPFPSVGSFSFWGGAF